MSSAATIARALVPVVLAGALGGCGASAGYRPPDEPPTIDGIITELSPAPSAPQFSARIESDPGASSGSPKFVLRVDPETRLLRWNDDANGYGTIEPIDLEIGRRVRAWVTGPIAESYPAQARAHTIVLVD